MLRNKFEHPLPLEATKHIYLYKKGDTIKPLCGSNFIQPGTLKLH